MKIDCPHCGVHGSIDDSLANKKLRCQKCSKVFLVPEVILPTIDDAEVVNQTILPDDESVITDDIDLPKEETPAEDDEEAEELSIGDQSSLGMCSACGQSFASELLVEVDFKLFDLLFLCFKTIT